MVTLAAIQKTIVRREARKWGYNSWKATTVIQVSDGWWLGLGWWRSEKWSDFGYLQGNAGRTSFLISQGMIRGTWWVDALRRSWRPALGTLCGPLASTGIAWALVRNEDCQNPPPLVMYSAL